jgi:hypothetical protein
MMSIKRDNKPKTTLRERRQQARRGGFAFPFEFEFELEFAQRAALQACADARTRSAKVLTEGM